MPDPTTVRYAPIAVSTESTVVAEFEPAPSDAVSYQSEAELEKQFIAMLGQQAYEYLPLTSDETLRANLRTQLEALNNVTFSPDLA